MTVFWSPAKTWHIVRGWGQSRTPGFKILAMHDTADRWLVKVMHRKEQILLLEFEAAPSIDKIIEGNQKLPRGLKSAKQVYLIHSQPPPPRSPEARSDTVPRPPAGTPWEFVWLVKVMHRKEQIRLLEFEAEPSIDKIVEGNQKLPRGLKS
ncbi:hypothetical protein MMC07_003980, partial [Pseudocyphellaria aurata]|nr:hypothetical protein [Pseudocyphellaria aurata]